MTGSRAPLLIVLALLAAAPRAARAQSGQEVRGTVAEGGSLAPVEGAMVLLLDAGGVRVAGVLSGVNGRFRVSAPTPGRYRLRVDRIGYGSTDTPIFDIAAGASVEQRVVTTVKPIELAGIDVKGASQCRIRPEEGAATHTVWEEARKALDAASWTSERGLYRFGWASYTRQLDRNERIVSEKRSQGRGVTSRPFEAASPETLRQSGFVERLPDGQWQYWAPDASVLLSDAFLDTHCFSLRRQARGGVPMLGLAFEPRSGRGLPDVQGVLWIDQATAQLRDLAYTYTNLPEMLENQDAGGDLTFDALPNGTWIVKEWRITMPLVVEVRAGLPRGTGSNTIGGQRLDGAASRYEIQGYLAEGGIVQRAATASGEVVLDDLSGGIRGVVIDSAGDPVARVKVRVQGTSLEATTDSAGAFGFAGVGAGSWVVAAAPLELEMAGIEGPGEPVQVGARGLTTVRLRLPTLRATLTAACTDAAPEPGKGAVVGRVLDENNAPVAGAEVRLSWSTLKGRAGATSAERTTDSDLSDPRGAFAFCAVPEDQPVSLQALLEQRVIGAAEARIEFGTGGALVPLFVRTRTER